MNLTQQQIIDMTPEQFAQFVADIQAASNSSSSNNRTPAPQTMTKHARDLSPEEWQREKRRLGLR